MPDNKFLGIEIGGTKLQIVVGYADGSLLATHGFDVIKEVGAKGIRTNIKINHAAYTDNAIAPIGIGLGGPAKQQIYHGAIPGKVEIGHIRMDRNGTTLESLCSCWGLDEKIRRAVSIQPNGALASLVNGKKQSEAIFPKEAMAAGDVIAQQMGCLSLCNQKRIK